MNRTRSDGPDTSQLQQAWDSSTIYDLSSCPHKAMHFSLLVTSITSNHIVEMLAPIVFLICPALVASASIARRTNSSTNCSASLGLPGAVYTCPEPYFQTPSRCTWSPPNISCLSFNYFPRSIGPDYGGFCELFLTGNCTGPRAPFRDGNNTSGMHKSVS
jgi:hypothetical protein